MRVFNKVRVVEAGFTTNYHPHTAKVISFDDSALDDMVMLGNSRRIHSRFTHGGKDALDNFVGSFTNFEKVDGIVRADFTLSDAADSENYRRVEAMIENEPDLCGFSVNIASVFDHREDTSAITSISDLITIDFVGLPAATSSLFSEQNNQSNNEQMNLFTKFSEVIQKSLEAQKFAVEELTDINGVVIAIDKKGDKIEIGDSVKVGEDVAPDGDYTIKDGDDSVAITVVDGVISEIKTVEQEDDVKVEQPAEAGPASQEPVMEYATKAEVEQLMLAIGKLDAKFSDFSAKMSAIPADTTAKTFGPSAKMSQEQLIKLREKFK